MKRWGSSITKGENYGGVPEGSPVSSTIFNLYIDMLGLSLQYLPRQISMWPNNIFADNVQILARTADGLQRMRDKCTAWASTFGPEWAPTKSYILKPKECKSSFWLAEKPLPTSEEVVYLGVSVSIKGITDSELKRRVKVAKQRIGQLKSCGMLRKWHPNRSRQLFVSIIRPVYGCALNLVPLTPALVREIGEVETQALNPVVKLKKHETRNRLRAIYGLQDAKTRRTMLASNLWQRINDAKYSKETKQRNGPYIENVKRF